MRLVAIRGSARRAESRSGCEEAARDREREQDIGDIDFVFHKRATKHTLLVKGKSHALPLPVYSRSSGAIDAHMARNRRRARGPQPRPGKGCADAFVAAMRPVSDRIKYPLTFGERQPSACPEVLPAEAPGTARSMNARCGTVRGSRQSFP